MLLLLLVAAWGVADPPEPKWRSRPSMSATGRDASAEESDEEATIRWCAVTRARGVVGTKLCRPAGSHEQVGNQGTSHCRHSRAVQ